MNIHYKLFSFNFLLLLGCSGNQTKEQTSFETFEIDNNMRSEDHSNYVFTKNDSSFCKSVLREANMISKQLADMHLVLIHASDEECFGIDSLYFDNQFDLTVEISKGGCSEIYHTTTFFKDNEIIYKKETETGDNLVISNSHVYFTLGNPKLASVTKINWNWETRTPIDTLNYFLNQDNDEIKKFKEIYFKLEDLNECLLKLPISEKVDNNFIIQDSTFLNISKYHKIVLDSTFYYNYKAKITPALFEE